jgi:hypothetical protein
MSPTPLSEDETDPVCETLCCLEYRTLGKVKISAILIIKQHQKRTQLILILLIIS